LQDEVDSLLNLTRHTFEKADNFPVIFETPHFGRLLST
jgi:hypothetical protein